MILLTGATGFLGNYLTRALDARGQPFRALVRDTSDVRYLRNLSHCELAVGDLLDPQSIYEALTGVTAVVHAAAEVSFQPGRSGAMLRTAREGTANIVNMMLEMGVPRLVYVSSVAALDREDGGPVVTLARNKTPTKPNTAYAAAKRAAELEAWRGQGEGLSVAALYPSILLGAGDWNGHNTPSLWRRAAAGSRFYPSGAAGFTDVRDAAAGILEALDRNVDGERYLLNAANLSWREVLTLIAESIEVPPPTIRLKRWQSTALLPLMNLRSRVRAQTSTITRDSNRNVQASFRYDGSSYTKLTDRTYLPIKETIQETGAALLLARSQGQGSLPPIFLPLK